MADRLLGGMTVPSRRYSVAISAKRKCLHADTFSLFQRNDTDKLTNMACHLANQGVQLHINH